jgi:hypothetical protein
MTLGGGIMEEMEDETNKIKKLLQIPIKAQIPVIRMKERQKYRGRRSRCLESI